MGRTAKTSPRRGEINNGKSNVKENTPPRELQTQCQIARLNRTTSPEGTNTGWLPPRGKRRARDWEKLSGAETDGQAKGYLSHCDKKKADSRKAGTLPNT